MTTASASGRSPRSCRSWPRTGSSGSPPRAPRRFEIVEWLDDAPHPRAEVRDAARPGLGRQRSSRCAAETEQLVRRTLAEASEFAETGWSPDVELADDPMDRCWQLAGIAPLGDLDRLTLLRAASAEELLTRTAELTRDARVPFSTPWPDDEG